MSNISAISWR